MFLFSFILFLLCMATFLSPSICLLSSPLQHAMMTARTNAYYSSFNLWECQMWFCVKETNKSYILRHTLHSDRGGWKWLHIRDGGKGEICYEGKPRERLTVCTLERQSGGKLTHTAAGWEHSERWQPKIKEGGRNGAMSKVRWRRNKRNDANWTREKCWIKAN